ncbi:MAG: rane-associated protein SNARE-like [Parcubacteria group bacterium]|nr:rane-associated protein SNARE-like [Parcubacteria group bacterium]
MHHFPHLVGWEGYVSYFSHLSYIEIFVALIASGHLIPIPESVTLIFLGYLLAIGKGSILGYLLVSIFSVAFFDIVLYMLSFEGSKLAETLSKRVKIHLFDRYKNISDPKLFGLIVLSHFVPGWRFANPIIAGIGNISWKKFLPATLLSAVIYAPFYMGIGYVFHDWIFPILKGLRWLRHLALPAGIIILVAIIVGYIALQRRKVYNKDHA